MTRINASHSISRVTHSLHWPQLAADCFRDQDVSRNPPFFISLASLERPDLNNRMRELPHTSGCFVCGESNASGLNLRFETDGSIVQARFLPRPEHVGFKQTVHGGILATILDEIMVWGCAIRTRRFGYCAEMTVRFLHPVRPGETVQAIGELVADQRGRLFAARGELKSAEGLVYATSTGKYIPLKPAEEALMYADFVGDASEFAPKGKST